MERHKFVTDTATLVVQDIGALQDRLNDAPDWWCVPKTELETVNSGSAAFFNLGSDGAYELTIQREKAPDFQICVFLNFPTGRVFFGAAEETTGGGLNPEALRGGTILDIEPGRYQITALLNGQEILIGLSKSQAEAKNSFHQPIRLSDTQV